MVDHGLILIEQVSPGQTAEVQELVGDPDSVRRLAEFGFRRGAVVEMVRPGRPCIVRLNHATVCVRGTRKAQIWVKPLGPTQPEASSGSGGEAAAFGRGQRRKRFRLGWGKWWA